VPVGQNQTMIRWSAAALLLLLPGCAGSAPEPTQADDASETSAPPAKDSAGQRPDSPEPSTRPGTRITVRPSDFGPMLFDARGQAIYLFDKETSSEPACYGACAEAWPPVLTTGSPVAAGEARPGLLGTTKRSNRATQVTYAGHPLYYYAHEEPGQVLCHDVEEYGGLWLVVTPAGDAAAH
jgi:predicted lipoprotein with Yx(FWY)xxD motif